MTRICNFPITETKRCTQPVADDKPNCGRHSTNLSASQLGQNPTVYEKGGELHVWAGDPDSIYCLIHNDQTYQMPYKPEGENPPNCLQHGIEHMDEDGHYHRDDGPALIYADGTQIWYQHGERHRDNGPALIWPDGMQEWWQHGEIHRDDGPAIITPMGGQFWYQHGEWHRDDGPAVVRANGTQEWYWHGKQVTKEEHAELRNNAVRDEPIPSVYVPVDDTSESSPSVSHVTRIVGDKQPFNEEEIDYDPAPRHAGSSERLKRSAGVLLQRSLQVISNDAIWERSEDALRQPISKLFNDHPQWKQSARTVLQRLSQLLDDDTH